MPAVTEFVFAFTTAATELEALVTSDCVASEPEERLAPVSVLVPELHTSEARVPKLESVLVPAAQTLVGIDVMDDAIEARDEPIEDDAVLVLALTSATTEDDAFPTIVLVLLFTAEVMPEVCALVLAFTTAATDDVAVASAASV